MSNNMCQSIPIIALILCFLLHLSQASTYIVSQEFHTQQFTTIDLTSWAVGGSIVPAVLFSTCGPDRIFGGYGILTGDSTNPSSLTRTYTNLIPHNSLTIKAKVYKIDSWPNNTFFVMVDGTTSATLTFNSTNPGTSDICGNPSPIPDSINTNYNDVSTTITATVNHTAATVTVELISNLLGGNGAWGVREVNITIQACDQSCQTCTNSTSCTSCYTGMVLSGPYCVCSTGIRQNIVPCFTAPCTSCVLSCSSGFYISGTTSNCQPCNIACSVCSSPANSISSCTACSSTFIGDPVGGALCQSCFSGCSSCASTAQSACLSCSYGYFLYSANSSCMSVCPSGWYGSQTTARCYACVSPCATCLTAGFPSLCLTCQPGFFYNNYTCASTCSNNLYAYLGSCLSVCPQGTRPDATYICIACGTNCLECNSTGCVICASGTYILGGVCYVSCPVGNYGHTSGVCLSCDGSCLTCNGPLSTNCLSCSSGAVVSGSCYSTCPSNTYSALCLSCDTSCLACSGPSSSQCISCASPYFLHLNYSMCLLSCTKGELVDNLNLTCLKCSDGKVGYYNQCVDCDPSCLTCDGIDFLSCLSCENSAQLIQNACTDKNNNKIIYTPDVGSESIEGPIFIALLCFVGWSLLVQLIFSYKTALLPLVQILQILSYTYYLSIKLTPETQQTAILLYYSNFASLLRPFSNHMSPHLPSKMAALGKTGYYLADALGVHVCMLAALVTYLGARFIGQKVQLIRHFYSKVNPYVISYMFRLVTLELALDAVLYLYCLEVSSTMGGASLGLLVLDIALLVFGTCWRIRTESDGSQVALYYNNQIGERAEHEDVYEEQGLQEKIRRNSIMPATLSHCYKIPIPLTILIFIDYPSTQCITLCTYFCLNLLLTLLLPYRRRIYKAFMVIGALALVCNAGIAIVVEKGAISYPFDVLWFSVIVLGLALGVMQVVVNYRFFIRVCSYMGYRLKKWREQNQVGNAHEESQSNLAEQLDVERYSERDVEKDVERDDRNNPRKEQYQSREVSPTVTSLDHPGKIKHNGSIPYAQVEHTRTNIENEGEEEDNSVKLDINL